MLRNFLKNRKAQNLAEYALLIALVIAAIIAVQTFVQRKLQAEARDASVFMTSQTNTIGNSQQYEPYYLNSDYNVASNSVENQRLGQGLVGYDSTNQRQRSGQQVSTYNASDINQTQ